MDAYACAVTECWAIVIRRDETDGIFLVVRQTVGVFGYGNGVVRIRIKLGFGACH